MALLRFSVDGADITNSVLVNTLKIEDILVDKQLNFGACNSARMQLQTIRDLDLTNKKIVISNTEDEITDIVGTYKVTYSSKKVNSEVVQLTAYDCVNEFNANALDWYNNLAFPMTIKSMRDSLCNYFNIEQVAVSLINDNQLLYRSISAESLNAKSMLAWIGQFNGVFPHSTNDYKLDWVSLSTESIDVSNTDIIGAKGYVGKSYNVYPIGAVSIIKEDGDIGVTVGTGANVYNIIANPLTFGLTDADLNACASNIYNKIIQSARYTPSEILVQYDVNYVPGALLNYNGKSIYVLKREISGQTLHTKIKCDGNEYLDKKVDIATQIEALRGRSNVFNRTLDETILRIEDIDEGLHTEITQLSNSVDVRIANIQAQIDGSIRRYYVTEAPTLLNYPAWDFTYNIPCNDTVQTTDELRFEYNDTYYMQNAGVIASNIETGENWRFSHKGGVWHWELIADTEMEYVLQQIADLQIKDTQIEASINSVSTNLNTNYDNKTEIDNKLQLNNSGIYTNISQTYYTKGEVTGLIDGKLELYFKKGEDDQNIISVINAAANEITINSDNFKLEANGKITATAGDIGSWEILNNGGLRAETTWNDGSKHRAWLNVPTENETDYIWVYSVQKDNVGLWQVDSLGRMTFSGSGGIDEQIPIYYKYSQTETNYVGYVGAMRFSNDDYAIGIMGDEGDRVALGINGYSYLMLNKENDGGIRFNRDVTSDLVCTHTLWSNPDQSSPKRCTVSNNAVAFIVNDEGKLQVWINGSYRGVLNYE